MMVVSGIVASGMATATNEALVLVQQQDDRLATLRANRQPDGYCLP